MSSTIPSTSTQIQLASRPVGWPTHENFRTVTVELPDLAEGEVRVTNEFISVDPYMRGRMNDVKSYVPPFALDETMTGGAVGRVVASRAENLPVGTAVLHQLGWRDVAQAEASTFRPVAEIDGAPLSLHLGILGMTGLTAYVGLTRIAGLRSGETAFISGAAGAVGSAAGQIARLLGAQRVVGSAGSAEKVELLTSKYGFDAALNYQDAPVREQLPQRAPDGVDVFFDNVGGDHLEAAIDNANTFGRIAMCGAIAQYNDSEPAPGPRNLGLSIGKCLTLRGFVVGKYSHLAKEFQEKIAPLVVDGAISYETTVRESIENMPGAFLELFDGGNTGKMIVEF